MRTFRISSRSSLKPSATDAIQNFRNLSFNICSFRASPSTEPAEGMNDGMVVAGGGGDGDRRFDADWVWSEMKLCCAAKGFDVEESELVSESDSEDEDEDTEGSAGFLAASDWLGLWLSSEDEEEDPDNDDDEEEKEALLFLFLLRFLVGALAGGAMLVCAKANRAVRDYDCI